MFGLKNKQTKIQYNPEKQKPVIKCSICTGEQTGCLKDFSSGILTEIMAIHDSKDRKEFLDSCGVTEAEKVY